MNSIKSILFLCLFAFILSGGYSLTEQDEYKCASNIKLNTCFIYTTKEDEKTVAYVNGCGKGKICKEVQQMFQCVKVKTLLEEGDKCELAEECQSGLCSSKKCVFKKEGEECTSDNNCGKGLFCKSKDNVGTCQKFLKEGDECESDDYNNLLCQPRI